MISPPYPRPEINVTSETHGNVSSPQGSAFSTRLPDQAKNYQSPTGLVTNNSTELQLSVPDMSIGFPNWRNFQMLQPSKLKMNSNWRMRV